MVFVFEAMNERPEDQFLNTWMSISPFSYSYSPNLATLIRQIIIATQLVEIIEEKYSLAFVS